MVDHNNFEMTVRDAVNANGIDTSCGMPDWVVADMVVRLIHSLEEMREQMKSNGWPENGPVATKE